LIHSKCYYDTAVVTVETIKNKAKTNFSSYFGHTLKMLGLHLDTLIMRKKCKMLSILNEVSNIVLDYLTVSMQWVKA